MVSPTSKWFFFAVWASIATSFGPVAQRPSCSFSGLKRGCEGSIPNPKVGLPFVWIALPFRPISVACVESPFKSINAPDAAATSGICRIRSSSSCETVALPPFE
jgi:hypothetical protein